METRPKHKISAASKKQFGLRGVSKTQNGGKTLKRTKTATGYPVPQGKDSGWPTYVIGQKKGPGPWPRSTQPHVFSPTYQSYAGTVRPSQHGQPIRATAQGLAAAARAAAEWPSHPASGSAKLINRLLAATKPRSATQPISRISQHQFGLRGASKTQPTRPKHKVTAASKKQFGYRGKSK